MSTERYDKQLREHIEAMDAVPHAFSFNPASTWQQLENRLQAKPTKKTRWLLYGAAAAVLIIIGSLPVLLKDKKQDAIVSSKQQAKKKSNVIVQEQSAILNKKPLQQAIQTDQQRQPLIIKAKKEVGPIVVNTVSIVPAMSSSNIESTAIIATAPAVQKIENITPTVANNIAQQPVVFKKAKMKIVHLNEMGQEQQQPVALTNAELKKAMQQQDGIDIQPLESNKSWWLFKAKAAASNTSKTINR